MSIVQFALLLTACATSLHSLGAADIHVTSAGAGSRDGSNWDNARAGTKEDFQAAWDSLAPGDTLRVGSGTYAGIAIRAEKAGAAGKIVKFLGVDRGGGLPLFQNNFDKNNPAKTGGMFFRASQGASYFEIEGLRVHNYQIGFRLEGGNQNIRISRVEMEEFREGIRSESTPPIEDAAAWSHTVTVADCRFVNFTKRAVRLQGGNHHWRIERCHADAGGEAWFTEPFAVCYQVVGDDDAREAKKPGAHDHHIEFVDCVALNTYHAKGDKYWNADGFSAERGPHDIRYVRCYSAGHTDGGWDDKTDGVELVDCVSVDNKKNFRFWGAGVKLSNCVSAFAYKRGGSSSPSGLWTSGEVEGDYCTFFDNDGLIVDIEKDRSEAKVVLRNSILAGARLPEDDCRLELKDCLVIESSQAKSETQIPATRESARKAEPAIFDSATFGKSKGFSSQRIAR